MLRLGSIAIAQDPIVRVGVESRIWQPSAAVQTGNIIARLPADIGKIAPDYWIVIRIDRDRIRLHQLFALG